MPMLRAPAADAPWFTFASPLNGRFSVYAFSGREEINRPYEFSIELVSPSASEDMTALLGTPACLSIADNSGGARLVHGLIREMEQLHTANRFTHYRCLLVPRLWFLDRISDQRIFQNLSVTEIIQKILKEQGFSAEASAFKLFYQYPPREYCVQYGETDLNFITRLCEEEGIYFYFEHTASSHTLCFSDREGGPKIPGESNLRFYPGSGALPDTAVISRLSLRSTVHSNAATYREWNFQRPRLDLEVRDREPDGEKAPVPPGMNLEQYRYPHIYGLRDPGTRYARLQLARQLTFRTRLEAESDVSRHLPGYVFHLWDHPRPEVNAGWWIVSVRHEGEQPGVLEDESPGGRGLRYRSVITAIPEMTRFVPALAHPKARLEGVQSALVTGPAGEEVYCDEYGRVKVRFHWDREGAHDENTTCWVRVADTWAGENFGGIRIPRIGQEVLVEYMEGDPDRPVITGRVYNALKMPPWNLPEQKTLSGIQSREFQAGRRNQLVLDDTQNQIQAQLSSDHNLSQLNLGYITRVNHRRGREDFRGEGFELRTDGWGAVRAARGMYIGTDARSGAEGRQKSLEEAIGNLGQAASQHEETARLAGVHGAQIDGADGDVTADSLRKQADQVRGTGKAHEELASPHLVLSSPAGIALTTPGPVHAHSMESVGLTASRHLSVSAGRSFLVSALDRVSLFAHKMGLRLMAGKGKVEIQAQSGDIDVIAEKVASLISASGNVRFSSPREILLSAGGSYIRISAEGVEKGTAKQWKVHAANHVLSGPRAEPWLTRAWKDGEVPRDLRLVVRDEMGRRLNLERYAKHGTAVMPGESEEHTLVLFHESGGMEADASLEGSGINRGFAAEGTTLRVTGEHSDEEAEDA